MNICLIVEGHGDVFAAPALIRRVASELGYYGELEIPRPFRLSRGQMVKKDELMRTVELMSRKAGGNGAVIILFDADDDCPVELAAAVGEWLAERPDVHAHVIVANREFECWYIASAEALRGVRGLSVAAACPADPDLIRDGKGWLGRQMSNGYSETLDQSAFAASIDVGLSVRSRSFRKFVKILSQILGVGTPATA